MASLAELVRAKYPGAYDDLSDEQLEASVRAKYPGAYDDIPSAQPKAPEQVGPQVISVPGATGDHEFTIEATPSEAQAMQQGRARGEAEAAPVIGAILGNAALGGMAAGSGIIPAAARAALSPTGSGIITGATTLAKTGSLPAAVMAGVGAAASDKALGATGKLLKMVLPPAAKAKVSHAVARGLKVAAEEAETAAPAVAKKAVKAVAPAMNKTETIGLAEEMKQHILKVRDETWIKDAKGLADQVYTKFKNQVEGLTPGKARQFTEQVLKAAPAAPKGTATDDMVDFVVRQAKETGGSRAQIAASLREMHPDLLTDSSARKVVDTTLDHFKLKPENTTAEAAIRSGLTMNDQIRAARARIQ